VRHSNYNAPLVTNGVNAAVEMTIFVFMIVYFNQSLADGHFPAGFREAFLTPILKKPGLGFTDFCSCPSISNLSVLLKFLERPVTQQLRDYLTSSDLLSLLQSGFLQAIRLKQLSGGYCIV